MARNQRVTQTAFGKLNQNVNAQDGEIESMKNISVTEYPVLTARPDRYAKSFPRGSEEGATIDLLGTDGEELFWVSHATNDKGERNTELRFYGESAASWTSVGNFPISDYAVLGKTIFLVGEGFNLIFDKGTYSMTYDLLKEGSAKTWGLDYVCSVNNRMWGCTRSGQIYASKLGDARNWRTYDGLSTDSWSLDMSVSTNEPFTGCAVLNSRPVFFTETKCVTVYGDYPSTFSTYTNEIYGVMDGCHRSIAEVNGYLYYLSRWGFVRYNSGGSTIISEDLLCSPIRIGDAENTIPPCCAGTDGRVYHACLHTGGYEAYGDELTYKNYVYDTFTGLWAMEDEKPFSFYCRQGRNLYALGAGTLHEAKAAEEEGERQLAYLLRGDMPVLTMMSDGFLPVDDSADTDHIITFAPMYETDEEGTARKWLKYIRLRMWIQTGACLTVRVYYDGNYEPGMEYMEYTKVIPSGGGGTRLFEIPCPNTNCDCYKIQISVNREFRLMAMSREYENMR